VFKIDLRGNGTSQGTPTGAYYSADYVTDTLNAYVALQSSGFVNPKKIGLWGHSMAGNIVLRSMAARPSIPAVVLWAGVGYSYVDMHKYGINDASYQRPPDGASQPPQNRLRLGGLYGEPNLNYFFWKQLAPISYLKDLKGAIEIHHAVNDPVAHIGYSRDLVKELDKTKVPHEYYEYEWGGHNIESPSFDLAIQRTIQFYKKYLDSVSP
jgi:dipeptidyl aminopeptidase/acylaminoacyl peptidase